LLGITSQKQIPSSEVVFMTLWEQNAAPQRVWGGEHPAESPTDSDMLLSSWKMTAVSHWEVRRKKRKPKHRMLALFLQLCSLAHTRGSV